MGAPITIEPTTDWRQRLAAFSVEFRDADGNLLASGTGTDLLGHPLNVARWIRDRVKDRGGRLRVGDLLSLGSLTAPMPVQAGQRFSARYRGLDGDAVVNLAFR